MPLTCPRCGGDVESQQPHAPARGTLIPCPYCSSTLYCQQGFYLSHEVIAVLLEPTEAKRALRRWFRERYQLLPVILEASLQYLPFWATTDPKGERHQTLAMSLPAGTPSPSLPEGQREPTTLETAAKKGWPKPAVSLESISQGQSVQEALLIWAPFYWVTFKEKGKIEGAWVDASLGGISAHPSKLSPSKTSLFNLSPLGYGIGGAIGVFSWLISLFNPQIILSLFIILTLALSGFFALSYWGKSNNSP